MKTLSERKTQLTQRLAEIEASLEQVEDALNQPLNPDIEERATERESDEVLEDLGRSDQSEIIMIQAALDRMEVGEYGLCAVCGDQIIEERLDLLPATPFCAKCARDNSKG